MPELFGASYRRADMLRRIGRLEQVAGVRLVTLGDGQGRGVGVINAGHTRTSHMFLYHCNVGFPVVDEGAELLVPSRATTTDYGVPVEGYQRMPGPVPGATEACFEHELIAEPAGTVPVAVVNRDQALGVYQVFRISELPHHTVWRMMGEGTYALAMEPSTNRDAGRLDARERGELRWLAPGEERRYMLEIGALPGMTAIGEFEARVSRLAAPRAAGAPGESPSDQKAVTTR